MTTPQRQKAWFSALSPPHAREYFRVKGNKCLNPRGREGREKRKGNRGERKGPSHFHPCAFSFFTPSPSPFAPTKHAGVTFFRPFYSEGEGGDLCPRHIGQNKILVCKLSESCRLFLCSFLTYHEETVEGSVIYPDRLDPNKWQKP